MDYTNIREKTIFDLCDDTEIAREFSNGHKTKDEYVVFLNSLPQPKRDRVWASAILALADETQDTELVTALQSQCPDVLDELFNE